MKISIVTISYNQAQFLEECILSVLNQDYKDLEYIVVDPGSTDGSREIIEKYRDRISHIVYEKDSGAADGLNKGFEKATGDIFCYLNSDDAFLDNVFNNVVEEFRLNSDLDIIYGHGLVIDEDSNVVRKCFSDKFGLTRAAYGSSLVIQPSTFFRAECFKKVNGFNISNKSNWDGELFIDMVISGCKLKLVNNYFSCYRVYGASITGSGRFASLHQEHSNRMFKKIMGREYVKSDKVLGVIFRVVKHAMAPRALLERVLKGPIFSSK